LAISDKKIIPRKTEQAEQLVYSDGIPAVPRDAKLSEFRSEPFRGRERIPLGGTILTGCSKPTRILLTKPTVLPPPPFGLPLNEKSIQN
jgi:hypothetical protein